MKLQHSHLNVGRPVPWNVYDGTDQLLLSRGFVIERESKLEGLLARGMYVDAAELEASLEKAQVAKILDPFRAWDDLLAKLGHQLVHPGPEPGFVSRIKDLAQKVMLLSQRHADASIAMIMLIVDQRSYPTVHCLQIAVLCELVSTRLGWEKPRRAAPICAALTMNIGMHELQQQLTNQRTPLTPEQQELVQQHPLRGADILRQAGVDSPIWLSIVENHHETANGTGYPRGIREMDDDTVLLRTLDLYCAKISPRMHRKPMSGTQAERVLFTDTGTSSDNIFIPALIKEIGNYPPGSFVKLVNGEIAVVYKRSASIDMPQVLSLINDKGDPLIEPIRRDTSREQFKIVKDVLRETILININPAKIWSD